MHVDYALDQSNTIKDVLQSLEDGVILAIILVMVLVVASLGLRSGILVGISIPTSFLIGFLIISMMGYTAEHHDHVWPDPVRRYSRRRRPLCWPNMPTARWLKALCRRKPISPPPSACSGPSSHPWPRQLPPSCRCSSAPGIAGEFMSYLPVTVIIVLSASLVTAMVFVPAVGFFIGKTDKETMEQFGHFADDEHADFRKMKGLTGLYLRFIERIIRHPALGGCGRIDLMGGIVATFAMFPTGVEFFVDTEPEQVNVYVRARGNLGNPRATGAHPPG